MAFAEMILDSCNGTISILSDGLPRSGPIDLLEIAPTEGVTLYMKNQIFEQIGREVDIGFLCAKNFLQS